MLPSRPPYALATTPFVFPAVAALAGRAPLGGPREVALGTFLVARLAHDALPERELARENRAERAALARTWVSTLALPPAARPALLHVIEASTGEAAAVATALRGLITAIGTTLDARSRTELERLAAALER